MQPAQPAYRVSFPTSPTGHQSIGLLITSAAFGPQMVVYVCECLEMLSGQGADVPTALAGVQAAYTAHLPATAASG